MNKRLALYFLLFFALSSCAPQITPNTANNAADIKSYLVMDGKLDKQAIQMMLYIDVHRDIEGKSELLWKGYYYDNSGENPKLLAENQHDGSWLSMGLFPDNGGHILAQFDGIFDEGAYEGKQKNQNKELPFSLSLSEYFTPLKQFYDFQEIAVSREDRDYHVKTTYEIAWYLPEDKKIRQGLLEDMGIDSFVDFDTYNQGQVREITQQYVQDVNEYLDNLEADDYLVEYMWEHEHLYRLMPLLDNEKYLVMESHYYIYAGGAHGFHGTLYHTFDKRSDKWLKLSDILDMRAETEILEVMEEELRRQYDIPEEDNLSSYDNSIFLVDKLTMTDNFTLSKEGITFRYGLYELTPYSHGYFNFTVPYGLLAPFIKAGFEY